MFDISDACSIRWKQFWLIFNKLKKKIQKFPWNTAKLVKDLHCLKTPQICYLIHAEHHAKNCTSLHSLDHDTLFFEWTVMYLKGPRLSIYYWRIFVTTESDLKERIDEGHLNLGICHLMLFIARNSEFISIESIGFDKKQK